MTENIDMEAFKKAGCNFEDIESMKRGLDNITKGEVYSEELLYSRLEKRLFSNKKVHA